MITVISGTNRPHSKTLKLAQWSFNQLTQRGIHSKLLDLSVVDFANLSNQMYDADADHPSVNSVKYDFLIPSHHWIVISPEYNGSFPGILKLMIDMVSVKDYKKTFSDKKVSLIGLASGRAGNFRGMEHLTGIFNYLGMVVMPNKLPISSIDKLINKNGVIDADTRTTLHAFLDEVIRFSN